MAAVGVDPLVDGAQRLLDADLAEERDAPRERASDPAREEHEPEEDRRDHEAELDPEVRADVVPADREYEPDAGERERRRAAERALEEDRPRHRSALAGVALRRLVDPHPVAADRGRQHLARGVRGEV